MLESIWTVLGNFGLDLSEIANAMANLFAAVVDAETGEVVGYSGSLAALADVPVVGEILKAFASFAPSIPSVD